MGASASRCIVGAAIRGAFEGIARTTPSASEVVLVEGRRRVTRQIFDSLEGSLAMPTLELPSSSPWRPKDTSVQKDEVVKWK